MPRLIESADQFLAIGENIHATRVLRRDGRRVTTLEDGSEAVPFIGPEGEPRLLTIPERFLESQPYQQGQLKHFMIAVWKGVHGNEDERDEGLAYVLHEVGKQVRKGAAFLDLNVDEVSYNLDEQKRSMKWLVEAVEPASPVPLSVDSSNSEIIAEGLAAYQGIAGPPLLNSVALERIDALDLVEQHHAHVMITAASRDGMPENAEQRVENVSELMEEVLRRGIERERVFVDPLAFPISVSQEYGHHFFDAVSAIRQKFGDKIHISGGMSNVSFGLPRRRLINDAFIHLAIEHGADSGIIDPVQSNVSRILQLDMDSEPVRLAMAMLLGEDEFCTIFLQAYRDGRLG